MNQSSSSPGIVAAQGRNHPVAAPPPSPAQRASLNPQGPPSIPDHGLLGRIGGGAYGEVWLARNVLGELRAVKVIHRSRFNDARPFEREFEGIQRFEPISRSHPSQLAILHVGKNEEAGCFYYVMELADAAEDAGERAGKWESEKDDSHPRPGPLPTNADTYAPKTLHSLLLSPAHSPTCPPAQHTRLPITDCIQIGLSLTTALAHLHQHGLVHRDIKPSNVIFVNSVPKLSDIGLVTEAGDTQSIVGTEGHLPPEGPGTPQADIFSLGKVLYEISTGLDRRRFAELPEDLRSWPDRKDVVEFNEILLKACAKDAARRYRSANELRADLELLQGGQSVKRRRAWERTWSHAKKATLATASLVVVFALVYSLPLWRPTQPPFTPSKIPAANEEYESGLHSLHTGSDDAAKQAFAHFEHATQIDPLFAAAWVQLAGACISTITNPEKITKARAAAEEALLGVKRTIPKLLSGKIA